MSIFSFLSRKRETRAPKQAVKSAPPGNTPRKTLTQRLIYYLPRWLRGDYTLRNSELIFSAISRISNALSAMPVQLYRDSTPVRKKIINDLVRHSPNPNMTSCQFFKTMEACRDTYGNAYAMKVLDADWQVERIDVLDPSKVSPIMLEESGELWYRITPEKGSDYFVHNFYIIHVPFISTNGYSGINPVSVLQDTLDYNAHIEKFSASQLEKGVNAQIILEAPANLGKEQRDEAVNDMMDTYKKTGGNVLLLESGLSAHTLNLSPVDAELFEVEKISRSRVAMVYNIPPHLLGDYSDTSFSSQEQQMLEFLMLTMLPIVTAYEQELNRKLLTREERQAGYHFKFDMESILRADAATMADVNFKGVRSGWKTPDEIRRSYGDAPLPRGEGKKAWISKDLAPMDGLLAVYAANPNKITDEVPEDEIPENETGGYEDES